MLRLIFFYAGRIIPMPVLFSRWQSTISFPVFYEDSVQYVVGESLSVDYIITRNTDIFSRIRVYPAV